MTFQFNKDDFNRYVSVKEHGGRHIWHDLQELLKKDLGVPFSAVPWKPRQDWLDTLWFAPKRSPRGSWTNQAQFVIARSIVEKKLRYGLSVECAPLPDSEQPDGVVDRDGWRLLSELNNQDFKRQIDELLTQEGWTILARNWENDQHYDGKSLSQAMGLLGTVQKDQGWEVCIWKSLSTEAAIAAGEEISEQIVDAFLEVRPLWIKIIPKADRKYLVDQQNGDNLNKGDQDGNDQNKNNGDKGISPPLGKILKTHVASQNLHFTPWQLATFYTALQTKGFVILSGISGTGKTRLAQAFAGMLPQPAEGANHLFVTVRPDWRDSKSLLGYYNPLTGTYEWTPFLRFLLLAVQSYEARDGLVWFVILDEMNLAHVEYYFADLLSVMESGRDEDSWTREPLRLGYPDDATGDLPPRELKLPPSLYIVGTVNVDETTHAFSPKVFDRAFTLELTDVDFTAYPAAAAFTQPNLSDQERNAILKDFTREGRFARIDKQVIADYAGVHAEVRSRLQDLNNLLRPHDLHFGYRVFDEIVAFLAAAQDNKLYEDLNGEDTAFDAAVLMKVLPKFHGSRSRLEKPLCSVLAWCVNPLTPNIKTVEDALREIGSDKTVQQAMATSSFLYLRTAERIQCMLSRLYTDGFAAFG